MTTLQQVHPTTDQLTDFILGRLGPDLQAEIESHVHGCNSCCQALRAIPEDSLLRRLRAGDTSLDKPRTRVLSGEPGACDQGSDVPPELVEHPRYRIVRVLGVGGMGIVYQAVHRLMDRTVALKVISEALTCHPTAVDRFRLEVKAAARLSHPNIVAAHDADQAGDRHFLVMEYVEGVSLARLIQKRGPLPVAHACHYARQAALGLQHAFEHGMVHRDIKPHNLMLTRKGQVKILDFGLARFARERGPSDSVAGTSPTGAAITMAGALLGTPDYMAPEQALDASTTDIRADVYSLGCTLYCLLTGKEPFPGGSTQAKVESHRDRTPEPLNQMRAGVPDELVAVVEKMMAKDPADRYQTPAEVAQALAPFTKPGSGRGEPSRAGRGSDPARSQPALARTVVSAPPARRPERPTSGRRWLLPVGGLAAVLLAVAGGLIAWAIRPPAGSGLDGKGSAPGAEVRQAAGTGQAGANAAAVARTQRVLMVLPHENFWYPDYGPVRRVLEQGGAQVKVASSLLYPARSAWTTEGNKTVPTDLLLKDARPEDYDAVVFVGAPNQNPNGPEPIEFAADNPEAATARRLIDGMLAAPEKKYIAALCRGTLVLVDAQVLQGKRAAGNGNLPKRVMNSGISWVLQEPVVVTGRIITARDWKDAEVFARQLLNRLNTPE